MAAATAALCLAGYALHVSAADVSSRGAYLAFSSAILVWGWLEMSFLMGFITGPRKHACAERCSGWPHFLHATQAIIYNELATLAGAALIFAATYRAPNRLSLWTYLLLWAMRLSAKFNLFLGVPNLGEKFLPPHLQYLKSFFRRRPINFLFPITVTAATLVSAWLVADYIKAADEYQSTSDALLGSLMVLALVEHWFMVLPLPSEKLWTWAFKSHRRPGGRDTLEQRLAGKVPYHP